MAAHGVGCKRWPRERFSVRLGPARTLLYLCFAGRRLIRGDARGVGVRPGARRVPFTGVLHYRRNRGNRQIGTLTRTTTDRSARSPRVPVWDHRFDFVPRTRYVFSPQTSRCRNAASAHASRKTSVQAEGNLPRVGISYYKADSA